MNSIKILVWLTVFLSILSFNYGSIEGHERPCDQERIPENLLNTGPSPKPELVKCSNPECIGQCNVCDDKRVLEPNHIPKRLSGVYFKPSSMPSSWVDSYKMQEEMFKLEEKLTLKANLEANVQESEVKSCLQDFSNKDTGKSQIKNSSNEGDRRQIKKHVPSAGPTKMLNSLQITDKSCEYVDPIYENDDAPQPTLRCKRCSLEITPCGLAVNLRCFGCVEITKELEEQNIAVGNQVGNDEQIITIK